jgi:hypothetical protein
LWRRELACDGGLMGNSLDARSAREALIVEALRGWKLPLLG